MNIQWDDDKFSFVHQYGSTLIDMVDDERLLVLDSGCDSGANVNSINQTLFVDKYSLLVEA